MAEGARLESVFTGNRNVGSNPTPSAKLRSRMFADGNGLSLQVTSANARPWIFRYHRNGLFDRDRDFLRDHRRLERVVLGVAEDKLKGVLARR